MTAEEHSPPNALEEMRRVDQELGVDPLAFEYAPTVDGPAPAEDKPFVIPPPPWSWNYRDDER